MNIDLLPMRDTPESAALVLQWSLKLWRSKSIPGFSEEDWTNFYERAKTADFNAWHGDGQELIYIAKSGNKVVGTIALTDFDDLEEYRSLTPWVAAFIVHPELRGQGYGTKILEALEEQATSLGIRTLHLWTEDHTGFYTKRGYEFISSGKWSHLRFDVLRKNLINS
ncbi:MAG TPA: GNAT family N-acetyltransferase [Candidatus Paceibacterota bacterium]|nr:GNAT family N-acetyltransferase [Candidatus Paceibacterota bacterium]